MGVPGLRDFGRAVGHLGAGGRVDRLLRQLPTLVLRAKMLDAAPQLGLATVRHPLSKDVDP
jgi:hypothetical protein